MRYEMIIQMAEKIKDNIRKVIVGKDEVIDLLLVSLICSGHVLLEDVPGVGKTMLAKCLARSINCSFKRIQFTPDLLPSDLTGVNCFNQKLSEFIFRPGPIFSNIILADEINRATPRTQSSLLECMEERQVTVDGVTMGLERPFLVIATQNPVEIQGTFPLPEAQLDRFFIRLKVGYPATGDGVEILERFQERNPFDVLAPVVCGSEVIEAQESFSTVHVSRVLKKYIVSLVESTRHYDRISLGVSPRGSIALMKASQALAVLRGRGFATPDDVKHMALPVLCHRMILKGHNIMRDVNIETVMGQILNETEVPTEAFER